MTNPGPNDGLLMVELAQWGSAMELDAAQAVLFAEDFDPDSASAADEPVRKVLLWGETVATMVKHDLFPEALVLDWIWIEGLWSRVAPAVCAGTRAARRAAPVREPRSAGRARLGRDARGLVTARAGWWPSERGHPAARRGWSPPEQGYSPSSGVCTISTADGLALST